MEITGTPKQIETTEIVSQGHLYRITGHPSVIMDKFCMVEVLVAETLNRNAHWRRLNYSLKREQIVDLAQRTLLYTNVNI